MTDNPICLLLVDDQDLMRQGLKVLLDMEDDISIIGDVDSGEAAVAFMRQNDADVVLMDVRMPGIGGIAATRVIRETHPQTGIIILTTFEDEAYLLDGLAAGAAGYLLKATSADRVAEAVRAVAAGDGYLQPAVAAKVAEAYARLANAPRRRDEANRALIEPLTDRELDVLVYLATGATNREIAAGLFLSEGTVKNYVTSILGKLGVSDRAQAASKGQEMGLI